MNNFLFQPVENYQALQSSEYYELFTPIESPIKPDIAVGGENAIKINESEIELSLSEILKKTAVTEERCVYMQIPFCNSHCIYCPFYRYSLGENIPRFVDATITMLETIGKTHYISSKPFDTFFFGGGTPTALELPELERILSTLLKYFKPSENHEFTVESNITNISPELLSLLKEYQVNRISLGVQSFDPEIRHRLGRRADSRDIVRAVETVRKSGMRTSVDLLYSIPGQTVKDFTTQVRTACELGVDNISQYRIKLFPGTPLHKMIETGKIPPLPSRQEWIDIQLAGWDEAEKHGYRRWNTKNFGKTETEHCRYTSTRYSSDDIIPVGCGAGGRIGLLQLYTDANLSTYCSTIENGGLPYKNGNFINTHSLSLEKSLGLLQQKELDLGELAKHFNVDPVKLHQNVLEELEMKHLVEINGDKVRLTRLGVVWWPEISHMFKAYHKCYENI